MTLRPRNFILILLALLILAGTGVVAANRDHPSLSWRLELLALRWHGALAHESWATTIRRVLPARFTDHYEFFMMELTLPAGLQTDTSAGRDLFEARCRSCHLPGGQGVGPDLSNPRLAIEKTNWELYTSLTRGIDGTAMAAFSMPVADSLEVLAYVRDAQGSAETAPASAATVVDSDCEKCALIDVTATQIESAMETGSEWLSYSGDYSGQRYSPLSEIDRESVSRLRPRWIHQMNTLGTSESVPIVVGEMLFFSGASNEVIAIDLETGSRNWVYEHVVPHGLSLCCGKVNRGVAVYGNRVFHAGIDGRLVALNVTDGSVAWETQVADHTAGYSMTAAPLAVNGLIVVGVSGGDFGVRGYLDAYDAQTGERRWRFYTVPEPGQPGAETWGEGSDWERGGGATWLTGSYDPSRNLLIWGTGNPAPTFNGDARPGDNLYTASAIAVDASSGELRWHYQFTPNDVNDYDANQIPVLLDGSIEGEDKSLVLWANRNCFFYVLDRDTGDFIRASPYCEQNWNDGFTDDGVPIRRPGSRPTAEGTVVYPGAHGGANWYSPAFNPDLGLLFVNHRINDHRFTMDEPTYKPGSQYAGGAFEYMPGSRTAGTLSAIDWRTGEVVWQVEQGRFTRSGLLATASGLVFFGTSDRKLKAFDARTGQVVWEYSLGGNISMGPITYSYRGRQELAIISGNLLIVMGLVD